MIENLPVSNLTDIANQIGSVIVVLLFLRGVPAIVVNILDALTQMKERDLERIRLLADMWERLFILQYNYHRHSCNECKRKERDNE